MTRWVLCLVPLPCCHHFRSALFCLVPCSVAMLMLSEQYCSHVLTYPAVAHSPT